MPPEQIRLEEVFDDGWYIIVEIDKQRLHCLQLYSMLFFEHCGKSWLAYRHTQAEGGVNVKEKIKRIIQRGTDNACFEATIQRYDEGHKTGFQGGRIVNLGIRDLRTGKVAYWFNGRAKKQTVVQPAGEDVKNLVEYIVLKYN